MTGTEASHQLYRDYFFDMFNYVTPTNDFKWVSTESTRGVLKYDKADEMVQIFSERGSVQNQMQLIYLAW